MKFNEKLKEIRISRGLTQKNVYQILKCSPNCYASWEQGRTQPDIDSIKKLCVIFDVSADYLIGLEDDAGVKIYGNNYNNYGTHNGNVEFKK